MANLSLYGGPNRNINRPLLTRDNYYRFNNASIDNLPTNLPNLSSFLYNTNDIKRKREDYLLMRYKELYNLYQNLGRGWAIGPPNKVPKDIYKGVSLNEMSYYPYLEIMSELNYNKKNFFPDTSKVILRDTTPSGKIRLY